jgi:hypothetical protein
MSVTVEPLSQTVYAALVSFIQSVLGVDYVVVQGLGNRASMPPPVPGFVAITETLRQRLRTNEHSGWFGVADPTTIAIEEGVKLTIQVDVYGPTSDDQAQMLSTLFRDEYGCEQLAPTCQPLDADDPVMIPLIDSEDQYEQRWTLTALLQYNPVTTITQQYANVLGPADLINVDERYPP